MTAGSTADWLRRVPKVELHFHLEGAIPHAALWALVQKYGGDPAVPDRQALVRRFAYRDFPHFIETWIWKNRFLREYEDFSMIAEAVARDLARQKVRYVEAHYFAVGLPPPGPGAATVDRGDPPGARARTGDRDGTGGAVIASWLPADRRRQLAEDLQGDTDWR